VPGRTWTPARIVVLTVVAAGVAVLVAFVVARAIGSGQADPADEAAQTTVGADVAEDLATIEGALNSGDPAAVGAVLTREAAAGLDPTAPVLPAGSTVEILDESFVQSGEETAYVSADVSGPEPGRHVILLWRQDDVWRVVATSPAP
jgi:hypothetical protein